MRPSVPSYIQSDSARVLGTTIFPPEQRRNINKSIISDRENISGLTQTYQLSNKALLVGTNHAPQKM